MASEFKKNFTLCLLKVMIKIGCGPVLILYGLFQLMLQYDSSNETKTNQQNGNSAC